MFKNDKEKIFSDEEMKFADNIHKKYGKSFYKGTIFFSKKDRVATNVLYTFVRIPDEIVDNPTIDNPEIISNEINEWIVGWEKYFKSDDIEPQKYIDGYENQVTFKMSKKLFKKYQIPFEHSMSFLQSMADDSFPKKFNSYDDLHKYMYGSASVVGIMMIYIVGFKSGAEYYADLLGDAFQMTNFLRDIDEDYHQKRQRIYMPIQEMNDFGLNEDDIKNRNFSKKWVDFMKFQIKRNREIYTEAEKGIPMLLSYRTRLGVTIARLLYSRILNEIEKVNYNIFNKRVRVGGLKKILLIMYAPIYLFVLEFKFYLKKI